MSDEVYRYDTFEVRDGVTMRQMVTTTAPAGAKVVLAADYDRLREENRRLHDSIAMLESLPGNELVRGSRERAEADERERDRLAKHNDELRYLLGRSEQERDEWRDRCAEAHVQLGIALKDRDDLIERVDRLSLELGRCEAQRDDLREHADRLAEVLRDFAQHGETERFVRRCNEALAAYRDAYPVPDTTT